MSAQVEDAVTNVFTVDAASRTPAVSQVGLAILIVEDNHFVARQCERVLAAAGFEVVDIVTTADGAVRVALERQPRLVLMDIYLLGKRDGVDAAIEIFERCGIRSIFLSAPADSAAEACAKAARPLAWLSKPFSDKKLLATIESVIVNLEGATCLSPLKFAAGDEKKTISDGPEEAPPCVSEAEFSDILVKIAALKNPAPALAALALAEVWRGLVTGEGPAMRGRPHFSRMIDAGDAALCEHILIAAGGEAGAPVSRQEVDVLIDIYETALERKDGGRFDDLLIKAIAHHVVATRGGPVPPRSAALAHETPVHSWASPADLETVGQSIIARMLGRGPTNRTLPAALRATAAGGGPLAASIASIVDLAA